MSVADPETAVAARTGNHFSACQFSPFGSPFDQLYQIQSFYSLTYLMEFQSIYLLSTEISYVFQTSQVWQM